MRDLIPLSFFLVLLIGTQLFALKAATRPKSFWLKLDYVWIGASVVGLLGLLQEARKDAAVAIEKSFRVGFQQSVNDLYDHFGYRPKSDNQKVQDYIDTVVVPSFERIQRILERPGFEHWPEARSRILEIDDEIASQVKDVDGDLSPDDDDLSQFANGMDSFFGDEGFDFFRRVDFDYETIEAAKKKLEPSWLITLLVSFRYYFLAIGLALRAAKVSAELRGFA